MKDIKNRGWTFEDDAELCSHVAAETPELQRKDGSMNEAWERVAAAVSQVSSKPRTGRVCKERYKDLVKYYKEWVKHSKTTTGANHEEPEVIQEIQKAVTTIEGIRIGARPLGNLHTQKNKRKAEEKGKKKEDKVINLEEITVQLAEKIVKPAEKIVQPEEKATSSSFSTPKGKYLQLDPELRSLVMQHYKGLGETKGLLEAFLKSATTKVNGDDASKAHTQSRAHEQDENVFTENTQ